MLLSNHSIYVSCATLLLLLALPGAYYFIRSRGSQRRPFPPGPWKIPLLGNIFNINLSCPWELFTRWKSEYGDLVGLDVLGTKIVVLNSHHAIVDLLEKRGHNYSNRPTFTVLGELMALNRSIMLIQYGPEWRECRRLEHLVLSPTVVKGHEHIQERTAVTLCRDLMQDPGNFFDLVRLNSARIVLGIIYGISPRVIDGEYITHAEEAMKIVGESCVLGAFLCDFVPLMKYLPCWMPFHRKAADGKFKIERMATTPFVRVKQDMEHGTASPSLLRDLLAGMGEEKLDFKTESRIMWTASSMYAAGAETTAGTILVFILAMALNPDTQVKAQEEIDRVIGSGRLPRLSDKTDLPYVSALVKEVMRWRPILPLSLSRCTASDDTYQGYFIPKGTIIVPNVWQIASTHNVKYPPEEFLPERFLDAEVPTMDPSLWAFGFGRRMCPGKALGETNVWIFMCTLLAVFDIRPPSGRKLEPQYESQLVSLPRRFQCQIVPRSQEMAVLIQDALL